MLTGLFNWMVCIAQALHTTCVLSAAVMTSTKGLLLVRLCTPTLVIYKKYRYFSNDTVRANLTRTGGVCCRFTVMSYALKLYLHILALPQDL